MFFKRRKKEKDFDILTEAEIQKKLYGHLKEDKQQEANDFEKKAEIIEKEQVKKEAEDRIKALEKKLVLSRESASASRHKISQLENEILSKEQKSIFNKPSHFAKVKNLGVFLILVVIVAVGLILLISRKKTPTFLDSTQLISPDKIEAEFSENNVSSESFYTIQVCLYEKEKDARHLVEELKEKKFDAYVYLYKSKSRTKYRVYVGRFSSEKSALRALKSLKKIFKDSFVRVIK